MSRLVGVKAYGWQWATEHGLSMGQAATRMAAHGVDLAMVQNLIDPLPGSAVDQAPPTGSYSDAGWVAALRERGIRTYQSTAVTFSPEDFARREDLRPIGSDGKVFTPLTWYYGICPTAENYLDAKAQRFADAVGTTQPDGVFLSFLRFPAFWELWLPGDERSDIVEYCFCDRCTGLFEEHTGTVLPGGVRARAGVLTTELRAEWTAFKCARIAEMAGRLRRAAESAVPGVDVVLNSFGLGSTDFGNAVEEVLGQRFSDLDGVIDIYELMFYFQIQKRDPRTWVPQRVAEVREKTSRTILACLQGGAEYLEDVYSSGGRAREITAADWRNALTGAAVSGVDGVLVYSWRDLLADEANGGTRVPDLLAYQAGDLTTT
ncbi:MAG: hypothetical protein ACK5LS_00070 [Propioniciclava sp.]